MVLFEDECHVKHGDSLGYVWGKRNERVGVRMLNERDSKTFFGVLDLQTHKFHLKEYAWANMESTVDFLKYLLQQFKIAKQLIIIWDGASFHKGALVQQFLDSVNQGLEPKDWKIHCLLFAPNAPEQNPVEDCWLKAKNYMRENILKNLSFKDSINSFKEAFNNLTFDFGKLNWYF